MLVVLQKGSKVLIQLEVKAVKVNGGTVGGIAVIDYIIAGGAVEVNYNTTGRQQGVNLAAGGSNKILINCRQSSNG